MGSDDMHCTVYDVRCYRLRCCIAVPFFVSTTAHEDVKHHPLLAAVTVLSAPMLFQDQQKKLISPFAIILCGILSVAFRSLRPYPSYLTSPLQSYPP